MSKSWVRVIAILEIVGSVFGIIFIAWQLAIIPIDSRTLILACIALSVYIFSFIAGLALWWEHPFGRIASIIIQAIQLPEYASQLVVFMFSFGFDAYVYCALSNNLNPILGFEFKLLAFNQLFVNVPNAAVGFGVSIPACIFLAKLLKYKPRAFLQDETQEEKTSYSI